eukprot:9482879-Pyramimonas_sp.AAC.2
MQQLARLEAQVQTRLDRLESEALEESLASRYKESRIQVRASFGEVVNSPALCALRRYVDPNNHET